MVATDMRSSLGWSSNRGMVLLKSTDLIHWQHSAINFPTRYTKTWKNVIRVWAPETIYDRKAGKYMVFYSLRTSDADSYDKIYYQYANKDFTDLEGKFTPRHGTIIPITRAEKERLLKAFAGHK